MKLRDYFKKAQKQKWAIGQFNFTTLNQLRGILDAAQKLKSPVIVGTSKGEVRYLGMEEVVALVAIEQKKFKVSVFAHLDHADDLDQIKRAIDLGYSSVHFDGSLLPLEKNIQYATKITKYAHQRGVVVEGELGHISGSSVVHATKAILSKESLTDPSQVASFVARTKVDSLAIAIGSAHGVYQTMPRLDFQRLRQIRKETDAFLVLHGTSGISGPNVQKAIQCGIVKANFNTELRIAWKNALERELKKGTLKPYKILPQAREAVRKKVEEKIEFLGSTNKA